MEIKEAHHTKAEITEVTREICVGHQAEMNHLTSMTWVTTEWMKDTIIHPCEEEEEWVEALHVILPGEMKEMDPRKTIDLVMAADSTEVDSEEATVLTEISHHCLAEEEAEVTEVVVSTAR